MSSISPVALVAGRTYTVAVYLSGSGGSYRSTIQNLSQTYGDIKIVGSTYIGTNANPSARPTNSVSSIMYGQADIQFTTGTRNYIKKLMSVEIKSCERLKIPKHQAEEIEKVTHRLVLSHLGREPKSYPFIKSMAQFN